MFNADFAMVQLKHYILIAFGKSKVGFDCISVNKIVFFKPA